MHVLVADLEADGFLRDLTKIWVLSILDPMTKDLQSYSDFDPSLPPLRDGVARLQAADRVVFHNGLGYDVHALIKLGWPLDRKKVFDTLVVGRLLEPQRPGGHSLRAIGERLGEYKGEWTDFSRYDPEMTRYCEQDVRVTALEYLRQIKALDGWSEQCVQIEHDVAWIISLQIENGFTLDEKSCHALVAELIQEREDIEQELKLIFPPRFVAAEKGKIHTPKVNNSKRGVTKGHPFCKIELQEFNPGSDQQVASRLMAMGWKPKEFTPTGQPSISESILATLPYEEAKVIARYKRVEKMLGQITGKEGWIKHLVKGRVHGSVNTNGARTGRMTHFSPNMAQVDKKEPRMRAVWTARRGWLLVGCDAEGLEARMLAHYLAKYDGGKYGQAVHEGDSSKGTDVHTMNQKAGGQPTRNCAKRTLYAMMYGGGDAKLGKIVVEECLAAGLPRPKGSLAEIGKTLRAALMKGITGLDKVTEGVGFKAQKNGVLKGLDGRWLECDQKRLALNTLLQGAGAIVMKVALILFHEKAEELFGPHGERWAYCANVHDEVQIECEPALAESIGQTFAECITQAGVVLKVRCPLVGSYKIGDNWKETH